MDMGFFTTLFLIFIYVYHILSFLVGQNKKELIHTVSERETGPSFGVRREFRDLRTLRHFPTLDPFDWTGENPWPDRHGSLVLSLPARVTTKGAPPGRWNDVMTVLVVKLVAHSAHVINVEWS